MKLNHFSDAIIVFGEAISMAKKHIKDEKKLVQFVSDAQKSLKFCSSKKVSSVKMMQDFDTEESKLPMLTGSNPKIPSFSKAVKISYSPQVTTNNYISTFF